MAMPMTTIMLNRTVRNDCKTYDHCKCDCAHNCDNDHDQDQYHTSGNLHAKQNVRVIWGFFWNRLRNGQ